MNREFCHIGILLPMNYLRRELHSSNFRSNGFSKWEAEIDGNADTDICRRRSEMRIRN